MDGLWHLTRGGMILEKKKKKELAPLTDIDC